MNTQDLTGGDLLFFMYVISFKVNIYYMDYVHNIWFPSPDDVYTLIHSRNNKLSWVVGHIPWECQMLQVEWVQCFLDTYQLVLYISHVFDGCTILFIETYQMSDIHNIIYSVFLSQLFLAVWQTSCCRLALVRISCFWRILCT